MNPVNPASAVCFYVLKRKPYAVLFGNQLRGRAGAAACNPVSPKKIQAFQQLEDRNLENFDFNNYNLLGEMNKVAVKDRS